MKRLLALVATLTLLASGCGSSDGADKAGADSGSGDKTSSTAAAGSDFKPGTSDDPYCNVFSEAEVSKAVGAKIDSIDTTGFLSCVWKVGDTVALNFSNNSQYAGSVTADVLADPDKFFAQVLLTIGDEARLVPGVKNAAFGFNGADASTPVLFVRGQSIYLLYGHDLDDAALTSLTKLAAARVCDVPKIVNNC